MPDTNDFFLIPGILLAYLGPAPGLEFIPYFLALLAWLGTAAAAVLLWPMAALMRRFRRNKATQLEEVEPQSPADPPESARENHNQS